MFVQKLYGVFIAACIAMLVGLSSAYAAGGIYFDDVIVGNDRTVVFADNFDDGNASDWTSKNDATVTAGQCNSKPYSLHLNCHGRVVSQAYHLLPIRVSGLVEAHARVWLPPVQEQYAWHHKTTSSTNLVLYSRESSDSISAGVELRPGELGYRIHLRWNESDGGSGAKVCTDKVVLKPGRWALLSLYLDSATGRAFACLDGKDQVSVIYNPLKFSSIIRMAFWGRLGDRVDLEAND